MPVFAQQEKIPLGIYVHVPFCRSKCQYCDFYSLGGSREKGLIENYLEAVCLHIKEAGALAPGYQVDTVYFGGGTPSFLGADGLVQILNAVRRRFSVSGNGEITFEANPDSVTEKLLKRLRAEGFNRISLGVQSDDDGLLKKLGRPHSYRQAVQAVELARNGAFDLIILDLMMPKIDGLQACMRIREFSNVPIIMLTARSEDTDKIIGFECGADDYITKPFNILELKARVRALLRRAGMAAQKQGGGRLSMGHITLDVDARAAWKDGKSVDLTAKEFDLMELLMRNPGRVYSRENLLNVVWGYEYIGDFRTVDVHIRRLREKLELDPANPEYIRTKWGVGYYLSARGPRRLENV